MPSGEKNFFVERSQLYSSFSKQSKTAKSLKNGVEVFLTEKQKKNFALIDLKTGNISKVEIHWK